MPDHGQVMGDKKIGQIKFFLKVFQKVDDLGLDGDIQGRDRLVADDKTRLDRQGPGHPDPLPLPAAEFMGIAIPHGRIQTHHLEQIRGLVPIFGPAPGHIMDN